MVASTLVATTSLGVSKPLRQSILAFPNSTATMLCPETARESTSIDVSSHSCITTWCEAMAVEPSRAAVADAIVLVPSSSTVRMSTAPPALKNGVNEVASSLGVIRFMASGAAEPPNESRLLHKKYR